MEDNFKAWQAATSEYGLTIKREDYFPLEGMPVKDVVVNQFQCYGQSFPDIEKVASLKDEFFLRHHQFQLYSGVYRLIDSFVESQVPTGIVTGGHKARVMEIEPDIF